MLTLIKKAQENIEAFFDTLETNLFLKKDVRNILRNNRMQWHLPESLKLDGLVNYLMEVSKLKRIVLVSPNYDKTYTRFAWKNISPYRLSLSLRPRSYLSHHTAMYLHGLIKTSPKTIYVNSEQSSKIREETRLEQNIVKDHVNSPPLESPHFPTFGRERLDDFGLNFFRYDSPSMTK